MSNDSTSLTLHVAPPAILSARSARGYVSLQLETHREAMERRWRLTPPRVESKPEPAPMLLPPDERAILELALRRSKAKIAKLIAMCAKARRANGWAGKPLASISDIQRIVANKYGVTIPDILSRRIDIQVARPRQIAIYLARVVTRHSLVEIGKRFDNRDHSTAMHAARTIERLCAEDILFREEIEDLRKFITGDADFVPMKEPRRPKSRLGGAGVAAGVLTAMQEGATTVAEVAEALNISVLSVSGGIGQLVRSGRIVHVRLVREMGRQFYIYALSEAQS
jgi:hypothetical protein